MVYITKLIFLIMLCFFIKLTYFLKHISFYVFIEKWMWQWTHAFLLFVSGLLYTNNILLSIYICNKSIYTQNNMWYTWDDERWWTIWRVRIRKILKEVVRSLWLFIFFQKKIYTVIRYVSLWKKKVAADSQCLKALFILFFISL